MTTKSEDRLELALQGRIIEFGEALDELHTCVGRRPRAPEVADRMAAAENRLLAMVKTNAVARRLTGIRSDNRQDDSERGMRLRIFCLLAFRSLARPADEREADLADLACAAAADPKLPPGEALLRVRSILGTMVVEDVIVGGGDAEGACDKARLPTIALEWLSGGKSSRGFLTMRRLVGMMLPPGIQEMEPPPAPKAIPSAQALHARITESVIGLDDQARALSSRLVMHLARAKLLREGKDPGTGNQAILLVGNSGCGKTWMMEVAAKATGCVFSSMSATAMTSEAYMGGKLDDLFRGLVMKAKGELSMARFGIAFADEWDSKAFGHGNGREVTTLCVQQEILVPLQGGEFLIAGKRGNERPMTFNSVGTFFAFAGAFDGLAELIRKKTNRTCIGFSAGTRTRRQEYVIDSIRSYGYIRAWVNRLSAVMFLPDPEVGSLEKAAAGCVLDSFNALVGELGIVLFPHDGSTRHMAEYALESRTFYRGIKAVWWRVAEAAVASGEKGTVLVGGAEVDEAIGRIATGSAGGRDGKAVPRQDPFDAQAEANPEQTLADA